MDLDPYAFGVMDPRDECLMISPSEWMIETFLLDMQPDHSKTMTDSNPPAVGPKQFSHRIALSFTGCLSRSPLEGFQKEITSWNHSPPH